MKDKESHCTANFATFLLKSLLYLKKKMDEFNYLQFLNDPNELLQAQDLHLGEFPTFSLYFDEYSSTCAQDPCDPESS